VTTTEDGLAVGMELVKARKSLLEEGVPAIHNGRGGCGWGVESGHGLLVLVEFVGEERKKKVVERGSPWVLVPRDEGDV
jgi:hypothetical protein